MATFTITLSEMMEDIDVDNVDDALPHAAIFGLNIYPIFDEAYRDVLNRKIIARFWNREIGHESDEMFRFRMQTVMAEEMLYFNKLYLSEQIKFDPMKTIGITNVVDMTIDNTATNHTTGERDVIGKETGKNTGTSTLDTESHVDDGETTASNSTGSTEGSSLANTSKDAGSRAVSSIMPQTHLSGNGDYADSANDQNSNEQTTASSNTNADTTENRTGSTDKIVDSTGKETGATTNDTLLDTTNNETTASDSADESNSTTHRSSTSDGFQALPSQLLQQYRDTILNIDMQILQRLEKLFMSVTSSGEEYFYHNQPNPYLYSGYGWY